MSNWVLDLSDQRADMDRELCQVELEIRRKKEKLTQLKVRKKELEASGPSITPVVTTSVLGQKSQNASTEPGTLKKKKRGKQKPKRHPGLPLQKEPEYYKTYLVHL